MHISKRIDRYIADHLPEAALTVCQHADTGLLREAVLQVLDHIGIQHTIGCLIICNQIGQIQNGKSRIKIAQDHVCCGSHLDGPKLHALHQIPFAAKLPVADNFNFHGSSGKVGYIPLEQYRHFLMNAILTLGVRMSQLNFQRLIRRSRALRLGFSARPAAAGQQRCHQHRTC